MATYSIEEILNAVYSGTTLSGTASAAEILNTVFNGTDALQISGTGGGLADGTVDGNLVIWDDTAGEWTEATLTEAGLAPIDPSTAAGQFAVGDGASGWTNTETSELYWTGSNLEITGGVNISSGSFYKTNTNSVLGQVGSILQLGWLNQSSLPKIHLDTSGKIIFRATNSVLFGVFSNGNFGVGTGLSPAEKLTVVGNVLVGNEPTTDVAPVGYEIRGPNALPAATVNLEGGDLTDRAGAGATGTAGAGHGGDRNIYGGAGYGTGDGGSVNLYGGAANGTGSDGQVTITAPTLAISGATSFGDDIDGGGYYATQVQNFPDMVTRGTGYWFDGSDDQISITDSDELSFGDGATDQPFSIISRIRAIDLTRDYFGCLTKRSTASGNREYEFSLLSGSLYFALYDDSAVARIGRRSTAQLAPDGQAVVVCGVYDGSALASGVRLYQNGVRVDDTDSILGTYTAMENLASNVWVGRSTDGNFALGEVFSTIVFNLELSETEVKSFSNGAPIPYKYIGASQTALTSGTLTIGKQYTIDTFVAGDDFTNVGAAANASGVSFIATGTTPTTWTNSSSLRRVGCVLDLNPGGITDATWYDRSGNDLHGTVSGAIATNPTGVATDGTNVFMDLPTSDPAIAGAAWIDTTAGRVLKISSGP